MNILSPSLLSADYWNLGESIRQMEKEQVAWLHYDVMDGIFVPVITCGMPILKCIRRQTDLFLDVHLMIDRPERYIRDFADSGADMINFHVEATEKAEDVIRDIHGLGKKAGITIKPDTPVSAVEPYLEQVDMVLVMTVEPGYGGQTLIPECLEKVREARTLADAKGLALDIEVDGGIYLDNLEQVLAAGANVIVSGSAVFKGDMNANIQAFLNKLR